MAYVPIHLTEKQLKWLDKHFKHTKNADVAAKLGISLRSVSRIAKKRGLVKTAQFIHKCQNESLEKAKQSHILNGTYPPKGFKVPGSEKSRFQKGVTPLQRLGKRKEMERVRKSAESRAKTYRSERARVAFGIPQKTHLRVSRQNRQHVTMRSYLKKLHYILDEDNRIAYYNEGTKRGKRIEAKQQPWYRFMPAASGYDSLS